MHRPSRADSYPVQAFNEMSLKGRNGANDADDHVNAIQSLNKELSSPQEKSSYRIWRPSFLFGGRARSKSRDRVVQSPPSKRPPDHVSLPQQIPTRGRPTVTETKVNSPPQIFYNHERKQEHGALPTRMSLPMQMAVNGFPRPDHLKLTARPSPPSRPVSGPASTGTPVESKNALTPITVPPRAASTPPSPTVTSLSEDGTKIQCSGTTQAGERCKRYVKIDQLPLGRIDPSKLGDVFCHTHRQKVVEGNSVAFIRNTEKVEFKDYIPDYLSLDTKAQLRSEMLKSTSFADDKGYIYTFQIKEDSTPSSELLFKVGRTNNVERRINEWSKQCPSQNQILRWCWPASKNTVLLKGAIKGLKPGPNVHRLETLIHLELADLVMYKQYLDPKFPDVTLAQVQLKPLTTRSRSASKVQRTVCKYCKTEHREIFAFTPWTKPALKDKEFDLIVKPVIERWGNFVTTYYPDH